jgi:hypothetical protein
MTNTKEDIETINLTYQALLKHSKEVFVDPTVNILDMILPIVKSVYSRYLDAAVYRYDETIRCAYYTNQKNSVLLATITEGNTIGNVITISILPMFDVPPMEVNYYLPNHNPYES